jgi:squalene-associated FAD-dependent desaturase
MTRRVVVVGGGLAGLAAATALAPRGYAVTVLESRNRLGGRAGSFADAASGQVLDACQHVSMGCCTNLAHFCSTVGTAHFLAPQPSLYFQTPDGRVSRFRADSWPAPFHLARSFASAHYLTPLDKIRVAYGLLRLQWEKDTDDPPFLPWLERHFQNRRTIDRFWGLVLTSALNEDVSRVGLRYARKVFLDGFLRHPRGFVVEVPSVPLARLYGPELHAFLDRHGVELRLNAAVKHLAVAGGMARRVLLRDGSDLSADWFVSALPFDRLLDVLPADLVAAEPVFAGLRNLETSPITSVHLWFDRAVTPLPHVVLVDCLGQWLFNRGEVAPGEHYAQVVVSAARPLRGLGHEEVRRRIEEELRRLFPAARDATLLRNRVVTEHQATFSAVPGVDRWRPPATSPVENLLLAGDWTATGWPATMEGAVRSGYRAAEALLAAEGRPETLVRPDLHAPAAAPPAARPGQLAVQEMVRV